MPHTANIYPHHELLNLAFYHLEAIQKKVSESNNKGIALDCMSCLIALAIGVEGLINFCGIKIVGNWKEKEKYHEKLKQVTKSLGTELNEDIEPFKTLAQLKTIRDQLAHPKPIYREAEVKTKEELNKLLESAWAPFCNSEYVHHAYKQVNEFEKIIYNNHEIKGSGILTSATGWGYVGA